MQRRWPEVEQRFLVDADDAHRFLDAIRPHLPASVRDPARPIEFVRTTYFDTDDLMLFRSQLSAGAWRVRIRQYACAPDHRTPPRLGEGCAFEVKECGPIGRRKVRAVGTPDVIARFVRGRDGGLAQGSGQLSPLLEYAACAIELGRLAPRLTTWFRRLTHEADGARVTVDQRIEFARPMAPGVPGDLAAPREVFGRGPPLVLELKLRIAPPDWLRRAMRRLFLATQFSKFRDGLLALQHIERARPHARLPLGELHPPPRG